MAIYGLSIEGRRKRVLVRAESQAKAVAAVVTAKALNAEEMQDALDNGEAVWKPGTPLPVEEEPEALGEAPAPAPVPDADQGDEETPPKGD